MHMTSTADPSRSPQSLDAGMLDANLNPDAMEFSPVPNSTVMENNSDTDMGMDDDESDTNMGMCQTFNVIKVIARACEELRGLNASKLHPSTNLIRT